MGCVAGWVVGCGSSAQPVSFSTSRISGTQEKIITAAMAIATKVRLVSFIRVTVLYLPSRSRSPRKLSSSGMA